MNPTPSYQSRVAVPVAAAWLLGMLALLVTAQPAPAVAQDLDAPTRGVHRTGPRPDVYVRVLTPTATDSLEIEAKAGETVRAHVVSDAFDPVLELAAPDGETIREVNDEGSRSQLMAPLTADGTWNLRVRADRNRGGGKYTLTVERWPAQTVPRNQPTVARTDRQWGIAHVRVEATKGEVLVVWIPTPGFGVYEYWGPDGASLGNPGYAFAADSDGFYHLRIGGPREQPFEVRVEAGTVRTLADGEMTASTVQPGGLDVWQFEAPADSFRELRFDGARLLRARMLDGEGSYLQGPPVSGKDGRRPVMIREGGTCQVWVWPNHPGSSDYAIGISDPTRPIAIGDDGVEADLPVGASHFWSFQCTAGQLLEIEVTSDSFDPLAMLRDLGLTLLAQNDDAGAGFGSRLTWLAHLPGSFRLQVTSRGFGGGGSYRVRVREREIPRLEIASPASGELSFGGRDVWRLRAPAGRALIVSTRASGCNVAVQVITTEGVLLAQDPDGGAGRGSVFALRLRSDTECLVVVDARGGAGPYRIHVIDDGE